MIAWPDSDRVLITSYLGTLRLRSANSRTYYRQVLHGFQDVAERYADMDRQAIEAWLQEWGASWRRSTLLHRARIVDRFLDHLVEMHAIARNPIAVLRCEYSVKQSNPIWRALASTDPDRSLAALRRPKPFGSVLGKLMDATSIRASRRDVQTHGRSRRWHDSGGDRISTAPQTSAGCSTLHARIRRRVHRYAR
jgi:hypothetical protein